MKCPICWFIDTKVLDSRLTDNDKSIRRRRVCEKCQNRFTTFEKIVILDLIIVKRNWTKQLYDREKIKKALTLSFAKRYISSEKIENILSELENSWAWLGKEILSSKIWDDIIKKLKEVDTVAYIRFASVYKAFDNLEDFQKIILE
jgi:transcriptional repressor NrdR